MAQLLSSLPIGSKVKFGKYSVEGEPAEEIIWLVVAKDHGGVLPYPTNSVTLLTERIIDLRCYDAKETTMGAISRAEAGNNKYEVSNIDQWLNKDDPAGMWYNAAHTADMPPNAAQISTPGKTPYVNRPGFLNAFSNSEKSVILDTNLRLSNPSFDGGGILEITRKVFLPAMAEISSLYANAALGSMWAYFSINPSLVCKLTDQTQKYTLYPDKPTTLGAAYPWWTRSAVGSETTKVITLSVYGEPSETINAFASATGVRPALNLASTTRVSDATDSDGCYVTIFNVAPLTPTIVNLPATIYGGKSNAISWGVASDPDGDAVTYQLECSINGGEYAPIYSGTSVAYAHLVPFGTTTVSYRVKATDPSGESSAYTTSDTANVINNNAPVISGVDTNLGVKSTGFTGTYTITDANSDAVTVTESIDGVQIRALVATLGETITYGVKGNTWLALSNGSHTLTIRATDGIDTTVRTYVFTKLVDSFSIRNSTPWASSTMPSRIMLVVTRNIPSTATFKVEVCNNGYDSSPVWEDATDAVRSGLVHVFSNTTKTASNWGVLVKVTVERNGSTGACYVSAIGGNFE